MAYQVYFAQLEEENKALMLAILKLKEEADALEPGEAELLYGLRGSATPLALPPEVHSARQRSGGGGGNRRGSGRRSGGGQRPQSNNSGGSGNSGGGGGGSNN